MQGKEASCLIQAGMMYNLQFGVSFSEHRCPNIYGVRSLITSSIRTPVLRKRNTYEWHSDTRTNTAL